MEIKVSEALATDLEGEEEVEGEEEDEDEEDEEDEAEIKSSRERRLLLDKLNSVTMVLKRRLESLDAITSRKRGSEELSQDAEGEADLNLTDSRAGTPPKRARTDAGIVTLTPVTGSPCPRLKKRRSEEPDKELGAKEVSNKRMKVGLEGDGGSSDSEVELSPPPASITGTDSLPSAESPGGPEDEPELEVTSVRRVLRPYQSHPRSLSIKPHSGTLSNPTLRDGDLDQLQGEVDTR